MKLLISEIHKYAKEAGFRKMECFIEQENSNVQQCWKKLGFRKSVDQKLVSEGEHRYECLLKTR